MVKHGTGEDHVDGSEMFWHKLAPWAHARMAWLKVNWRNWTKWERRDRKAHKKRTGLSTGFRFWRELWRWRRHLQCSVTIAGAVTGNLAESPEIRRDIFWRCVRGQWRWRQPCQCWFEKVALLVQEGWWIGVYLKLVIVYDIMQSTKNEAILLQVHQKRTPSSCRYWGFFSFCMVEHPFRLIAANVYCLTICRYNRWLYLPRQKQRMKR